jgi:hypothetical protein
MVATTSDDQEQIESLSSEDFGETDTSKTVPWERPSWLGIEIPAHIKDPTKIVTYS